MSKSVRGSLIFILVAIIWGFAFVAQSKGMDHVGPLTFLCVRYYIGGIVLLPFISFGKKNKKTDIKTDNLTERKPIFTKTEVIAGICCATALTVASVLQQYGILFYKLHSINEGKSGFLTALYIMFVPLIGFLFFKKKPSILVLVSVCISIVGLYFLCVYGNETAFNSGDILNVLCAISFAFHILIIDIFSPKTNGIKLSCLQFFFCGLFLTIPSIFEHTTITSLLDAWLPIFYAGAFSCGIAYTLQIVAQKDVNPTVASLLMSLESVFAVIGVWLFNPSHGLKISEIIGCVIMFAAIVLAQLPIDLFKKSKKIK